MSGEQAPLVTPNGLRRSSRIPKTPGYLQDEEDPKSSVTSTPKHDLIGGSVCPAAVFVEVNNETFSLLDKEVDDLEEEEEEEEEVEEEVDEEISLSSSDNTPKPSNNLSRAKLYKMMMSCKEKAVQLREKADTYAFQLKQSEKRLNSLLTVHDQYDRLKVDMKVLRLTNADLADRTSRAQDDVKNAR